MQKKLMISAGVLLIIIGGMLLLSSRRQEAPSAVPREPVRSTETAAPDAGAGMKLDSGVFSGGSPIPETYTCHGTDTPPPLRITGVPPQTGSLALVVDDPDAPAGTWVHWLVWNLPADTAAIGRPLPAGSVEGKTSFGKSGYGGPCPPSGVHRYFFRLYALDIRLSLPSSSDRAAFDRARSGHTVATAELMGTYAAPVE